MIAGPAIMTNVLAIDREWSGIAGLVIVGNIEYADPYKTKNPMFLSA
jgi:hypothetical protein